jgi:peptidoglycan/xylan/chitin deacetylase (PgdA/CDA1 family)
MKWWRIFGILALNYHKIEESPTLDSMCVPPATLEADLRYLKENGFQPITLSELADYMEGGKSLPARPALISFDDGYRSHYEVVYPLLRRYGFHANFNVVVSWVGEEWTMKWGEMAEMARSGVADIQSHTYDLHRTVADGNGCEGYAVTTRLRNGADGQLESDPAYFRRLFDDFCRARRVIEEQLGHVCHFLCYPYHKSNQIARRAAWMAGYRGQIWGRGLNRRGDDVTMIKRVIRYPGPALSQILLTAPLQEMGRSLRNATRRFDRRISHALVLWSAFVEDFVAYGVEQSWLVWWISL